MRNFFKSKFFFLTIGLVLLIAAGSFLRFWWNLGNNLGYAPDQPIPFSHKRHAGDNGIPCMYCHSNADQSKHATVPSVNICMNCHSVVKTDSPLIKQVKEYYVSGRPIEWVKVHDLADFVNFNHKRHIKKDIPCEKCHGKVEEKAKIVQVERLNMGFCVNCHRENKAPQDCYTCHH